MSYVPNLGFRVDGENYTSVYAFYAYLCVLCIFMYVYGLFYSYLFIFMTVHAFFMNIYVFL